MLCFATKQPLFGLLHEFDQIIQFLSLPLSVHSLVSNRPNACRNLHIYYQQVCLTYRFRKDVYISVALNFAFAIDNWRILTVSLGSEINSIMKTHYSYVFLNLLWHQSYWRRQGIPTPPISFLDGHFFATRSNTEPGMLVLRDWAKVGLNEIKTHVSAKMRISDNRKRKSS